MRNLKKTKYGDYQIAVRFPVFSGYKMFVVFSEDLCASRMARYGSAGAAGSAGAGSAVYAVVDESKGAGASA